MDAEKAKQRIASLDAEAQAALATFHRLKGAAIELARVVEEEDATQGRKNGVSEPTGTSKAQTSS